MQSAKPSFLIIVAPSFVDLWIQGWNGTEREDALQTFRWLTVARELPILSLSLLVHEVTQGLRVGGFPGSGILHRNFIQL